MALVRDDLHGRLPALQRVRRRRPRALQAATDRAAHAGRPRSRGLTPPVAQRYVELAVDLGGHVDGLVFSALGAAPPAGRSRARIASELEALPDELDELADEPRRRWFEAQVRALLVLAREEDLPLENEVEAMFGVAPRPIEEADLSAAHARLDDVLPGRGSTAVRYHRWLEENMVEGERVVPVFRAAAEAFRTRTRELVGLPDGEGIDINVVTGERWTAFSLYNGGLRSRFSYNADLPLPAVDVPHLAAHEAYPGHHVEDVWKDTNLVQGGGRVELTVSLAVGVQPVIAEGIAQLGAELVADLESHQLVAEFVPGYDAEVGFEVAAARRVLADVSTNLTVMHAAGGGREELRDWMREWSLQPPDRVEKSLRSLETRPFRGSVFCYTEGLRICSAFAGDDPARFKRLLSEQLTPADLD